MLFGYDPFQTSLEDIRRLRDHIRYNTLSGELECTNEELQTLRPMGISAINKSQDYVRNGLNPESSCTQVHYLKGHFLLKHLCDMVSEEAFFALLRKYIHQLYHGRLVHSTEFLTLFFDEFYGQTCTTNKQSLKSICDDWLDTKELPKILANKYHKLGPMSSGLVDQLLLATKWWKDLNARFLNRKRNKNGKSHSGREHKLEIPEIIKNLLNDQLVLLLENLLLLSKISNRTLDRIDIEYEICSRSPDVQHRFAELVVKHGCVDKLYFVEQFLFDHQSMGIYLYGEMALCKNKTIQNRAKTIFGSLKKYMDPTMAINVNEMMYGTQDLIATK